MGDAVRYTDPEKESGSDAVAAVENKEVTGDVGQKYQAADSNSDLESGGRRGSSSQPERETREDELSDDDDDDDGAPSILDRVASSVASRSSYDPGPPPDGGWLAWSQCLSAHFVICNSWGWINSFGVWQDYLPDLLPERSSFEISFIGSVTVFLLFFLGTFTGRLTDAGLFRPVFIIGSVFQLVGIFCTSLCTEYWQFMLAQGLCIGIGNGCLFCPSLALLSTYFLKKRALALGLAACGAVTGGLVFPTMARQLLPKIGFPWTIRAIGFIQLGSLAVSNFLSKPRVKPRRAGPLIELAAFKEMEYTFYAMAAFCFFWGVYIPFYYLPRFSREGLTNDPFSFETSLDLLLILNGIGSVGRIVPNYIADRVGAVNMFIPICGITSTLVFCWMAVDSAAGTYVWTVIYGFFAGGIQSLFPAALSFLTSDLRKLGVRMGMVFTIVSFAVLTGPPIAGSIVDRMGNYKGLQAFSGTALAFGFAFLISSKVVRMRKLGHGWKGKV